MGASLWAVAAAGEVCAPVVLLLCGLCCWPDDGSDTSSTGKHPQPPVVTQAWGSRASSTRDVSDARAAGSAGELARAGPSGSCGLSARAHRSHEHLARRRSAAADERYHSAPSVIDEVLHRRDWSTSTNQLHIPLHSPSSPPPSPTPPPRSPHLSPHAPCKKHHTNIKSSRNGRNKEAVQDEYKDTDATENISMTNFYIGEEQTETLFPTDVTAEQIRSVYKAIDVTDEQIRSVYKAKEAKQTFNESIKSREHAVEENDRERMKQENDKARVDDRARQDDRALGDDNPHVNVMSPVDDAIRVTKRDRPRVDVREEKDERTPVDVMEPVDYWSRIDGVQADDRAIAGIKAEDRAVEDWARFDDRTRVDNKEGVDRAVGDDRESEDRSGARHHSAQSPHDALLSRVSVEAVGYDGGACYLRLGPAGPTRRAGPVGPAVPAGLAGPGRARHASDGDILAHTIRPESGAFSESDLESELELDPPPAYDTLRRETAI